MHEIVVMLVRDDNLEERLLADRAGYPGGRHYRPRAGHVLIYRLLKYRVAAALAVIGCGGITPAVVVIEDEVLALVPDDI